MRRHAWLKWLFVLTAAFWIFGIQSVFCDFGGRQLSVSSHERVASAVQNGAVLKKAILLRREAMEYSYALLMLMVISYIIHGIISSAELWSMFDRRLRQRYRIVCAVAVGGISGVLMAPALYYSLELFDLIP